MIAIAPETHEERAGWQAVLALSARLASGWTVIGAQMVALHAIEHGRRLPRASRDFDLLVDVRLMARGTERVARLLKDMDFALDEPSPDGMSHRFRSGPVVIDVLASDGVGKRATLTTLPPARTVEVPGGSQALRRTEWVDVRVMDQRGRLPRPDLLGAILIKARAIRVSDAPLEQRRDLAFLLTLVPDPRTLARELRASERKWLREHDDLLAASELAWAGLEGAEDGRLALAILSGL
jgi:hypothetical protein